MEIATKGDIAHTLAVAILRLGKDDLIGAMQQANKAVRQLNEVYQARRATSTKKATGGI